MIAACCFAIAFPLSAAFSASAAALVTIALLAVPPRKIIVPDRGLLVCLAVCCVLFFTTSLFSVDPDNSLSRAVKVVLLISSGILLLAAAKAAPERAGILFEKIFPFLFVLPVILVIIEQYLNFPVYKALAQNSGKPFDLSNLNKNAAISILLFPVAAVLLYRQKHFWVIAVLAVAMAFLIYKTESQASQLSICSMLIAFALISIKRMQRAVIIGTFLLFILLSLALPFIAPALMSGFAGKYDGMKIINQASFSMRLENYDFLSKRIMEKPWTGYGMDSTRKMTFDTKQIYYRGDTIMHPHNAALQVWIEFGFVGVLAFCGFLAYLGACILRAVEADRNLYYVLFCGAMTFLLVSWSMWASWMVGFLFMLCSAAIMAGRARHNTDT